MPTFSESLASEPSFDWPDGKEFPRTNEEFYRIYGKFVTNQVVRYNKIGRNLEDLLQEIWTKLLETGFLQKFIYSAQKKYPAYMTAEEACDYLGVGFETWKWYQRAYQKSREPHNLWMPDPREGGRFSKRAIYSTEEVFMLEELRDLDQKKLKPVRPRKRPKLSLYGFKSYLAKSIHNFFANWCRTHDRRCKESVMPSNTVVSRLSTGLFRQSTVEDPSSSWEDGLTESDNLTPEDALDFVRQSQYYDVDLKSEDGSRFLELLGRGYTADQIFDKRVRSKKKVRLVATQAG